MLLWADKIIQYFYLVMKYCIVRKTGRLQTGTKFFFIDIGNSFKEHIIIGHKLTLQGKHFFEEFDQFVLPGDENNPMFFVEE